MDKRPFYLQSLQVDDIDLEDWDWEAQEWTWEEALAKLALLQQGEPLREFRIRHWNGQQWVTVDSDPNITEVKDAE